MLVVTEKVQIPEEEFTFTFARSAGPGGQNVNKVNSKAVLHWWPVTSPSVPEEVRQRFLTQNANRIATTGEFLLTSQKYRDQGRNVSDCLEKLRELLLRAATPPIPRRATKPTYGSKRRRLENKQINSAKKQSRKGGDWGKE